MAQKILNTKIREAYDTEANWMKHNPVLLAGQLAFSSDKYGKYKVGNGNSTWSQLQYATLSWGDILGKPSSFTPSSHTHTFDHITNLAQASVKYAVSAGTANVVAWNNVSGKPTSMQNPYALTISNFNNTKNVQYDGSSTQAVRLNAELLYGASDSAIAMANENSMTNTRYVKLLDLTSHNSWQRTNQQFLIATRNLSFLLNIYVASTDTAKFSQYNISYIPLSSNIEIHKFLTGIVHVDNTKDRFELWYEQQQWTSSVSVIPLGRSYEVNSGGYHFNGYITNSSSEGITTKPKFDIGIAIEKIMPVLYNGTGNAIDGAMTQQAVTIALETRALKEHSHTIANITNLQSTLDGKAPTTHEHNFIRVPDTRNENPAPNNAGFKKNSVTFDFKSASKINSPTSNTYVGLMSFAPWSETSGGNGYQMAFGYSNATTPSLSIRTADLSATTWGAWHKIYTSGDKPTPAEIGAATSGHTHNYAGSSSAGGAANSAVKLASARTIKVGGYVDGTTVPFDGTKNIEIPITYIPEARLSWGGTNRAGSVSVIDAAASQLHSANRFAFSNPAGITVEYSRDGSTWTPYSVSDSVKVGLVSGESNYLYIGGTSSGTTIKYKLRITLDAQRMGVYTALKKVLINVTTNGADGAKCLIERSNVGSKTNFLTFGTFEVTGWSGWNSIPIDLRFGGGSDQTSNTGCLRFTFSISSLSSSYSSAFAVSDIIALGDTYWNYPSEMSKSGHLYSYDSSQNAVFPANITAKSFIGSLQGTATNATTASKLGTTTNGSSIQPIYLNNGVPVACTYTLGKSVPSNAVFTDTNTWRPIQDNLTSTSTTDSLSANQGRILKGLVDGKAPSSHTHNTINDFSSGKALSISNSIHTTPETAGDYDIVVTNTNNYGNKLITMTKVSLINQISDQVISNIPLKAITNSQIDSLANL